MNFGKFEASCDCGPARGPVNNAIITTLSLTRALI